MRAIFISFLLMLQVCNLPGQKINRLNRHGERKGKWITFLDSAGKIKSFEGRFRNGRAVGHASYFNAEGVLERSEVSRFGILRTVTYYPNGKKRSEGKARIENLPDKIHYYYYGKWKYYNDEGTLIKYCIYEKGRMVRSEYLDKTNKTNDTLTFALNRIEKDFLQRHGAGVREVDAAIYNQARGERLRELLYYSDSLIFKEAERLLMRGYPSKQETGESAGVPFFVISYAPATIRARYEDLFMRAAEEGVLEKSSVAYFIDKLKIAQGKKQVYGTQYYVDPQGNYRQYSGIDSLTLSERRRQAGLPRE